MQIIATIYTGYRIQVQGEIYTVAGSFKARSGYKYICTTTAGRKITIDRSDLLEAQKDGSAVVLAAA